MSVLERDYLEARLRRHGEMYGCIQCYRHPADPCQEKLQLLAARRFLALTETGREKRWCETHDAEIYWRDLNSGTWRCWDRERLHACKSVDVLVIPADYLTEEE